jgi:EAL domain-containing protein (putative c-di-GMP-specific phosphodiesterase class I)
MAMYQAKNSGRNRVCFFDPNMQESMEARAALESDLRISLREGHLHLYYQIQLDQARQPIGAEALIRWIHPQRGFISPADFIPLAEESSLIIDVGNWVLDTACAQIALWSKFEQTKNLTLAVNISAKQFIQSDFVDQIAHMIKKHGINASRLKLELTESVVLDDLDSVVAKMLTLRDVLGVSLSLDDFGTGYSSLSYLKQLPLDQIKIDQSFVRDMTTDTSDAMMVKNIIDMAHNFGLNVIAEGVETEDQLSLLKKNGCMSYQGYLFSKPIPIEQFEAALNQNHLLDELGVIAG